MTKKIKKIRKKLSGDASFNQIHSDFEKIPDFREQGKTDIPLADALMSGFALFSQKDRSLLQFEEKIKDDVIVNNLRSIYHIEKFASDTQMREIIDHVSPDLIKSSYKNVFRQLQRGKVLEEFVFLDGHYLASMDGTGYFSSPKIHCDNCQEKVNKKTGEVTYSHAMLSIVLVHPDKKQVIPFAPEPIIKQDGIKKNDCERNAGKRLLAQLRKDHPHLPIIIIEDALASNAPHIKELQLHNFKFILGVKGGDHKFLFSEIEQQRLAGNTSEFEINEDNVIHRFHFMNDVSLNESNQNVRVNFLEYWEIKDGKEQYFSWITDMLITKENVYKIMRGGRTRWKIENETFNTLKNQGYQFEHNFGHGYINLSVNFALLMMLAFLVDQVQEICCPLFKTALKKKGRKIRLWENIRALFRILPFRSWEMLLKSIAFGYEITGFKLCYDTT